MLLSHDMECAPIHPVSKLGSQTWQLKKQLQNHSQQQLKQEAQNPT